MTSAQQHPKQVQEHGIQPPQNAHTPPKTVGRPKGAPSTLITLRLPLDLLHQLDRSLDHLEVHTGLKANRGMIARRALALFLDTHAPGESAPQTPGGQASRSGQGMPC